ncbi:hypothetical protein FQN57_005823 [Myotisia sp. PD_48]|nr:hypothetical protein FQN57_005823 [Myotisia sp. PD_48]
MGRQPIDIDFTLRRVFGKKSFRPLQREVILSAIEGHDVFLQAATSFGKSLCFQLPAVVSHGVTVVVSPLLSLMVDQVASLEAKSIPVATINSTTPKSKRRDILKDILSGHPVTRLLYVTPELCQTEFFRNSIRTVHSQGELARIAIDEAHCVSEWGHDFRPAYKALSWFRQELKSPTVPITALTATATERVRNEIISLLGLNPSTVRKFGTSSARPNIHYEVKYFPEIPNYIEDIMNDPNAHRLQQSQIDDLISWLEAIHNRRQASLAVRNKAIPNSKDLTEPVIPPMCGIIYVPLRALCEEIAAQLKDCAIPNLRAVAYHAGLPATEREKVQSMWSAPRKKPNRAGVSATNRQTQQPLSFDIIVATNAFGMGIDNPHVRFVVHWTVPRTFEGFVQESGRAGRDGCAAISLVYYTPSECERIIDRIRRGNEGASDTVKVNKRPFGRMNAAEGQDGKLMNQKAILKSFENVVKYCETTTKCRHAVIQEFSDDLESELARQKSNPQSTAPVTESQMSLGKSIACDYACDFCKEGSIVLTKRMRSRLQYDPAFKGGHEESTFFHNGNAYMDRYGVYDEYE